MRTDPQTLLRGLAKFVAVVVVAGLVGAGLGVGLAKLSGNDGGETEALPAPVTATSGATTAAPSSATATPTETTPTSVADYQPPRVEVLSALLGPPSASTGRALVAVRVRVTNRGGRPLRSETPALLSDQDEVPPNASTDGTVNPLIRSVAPGASATGTLRFTLSPEITQRLTASPSARLQIARRIVALNFTRG